MGGEDARHQSLTELHERRKEVIRLHLQGHRTMQIVALTGLSWPAVRRTLDLYLEGGEAAIAPAARGKRSGDGRRLDAALERRVRETILHQRPEQIGLDAPLWDRQQVLRLIQRDFDLQLTDRAIGNYIARWGFTPATTPLRNPAGFPAASADWLRTHYPALAARARTSAASVHWITAAPIAESIDGTADAEPRATDTAVRLGAVTNLGKTRWMITAAPAGAGATIEFLDALARSEDGRPCIAIIDAAFSAMADDLDVVRWIARDAAGIELVALPTGHAASRARSAPVSEELAVGRQASGQRAFDRHDHCATGMADAPMTNEARHLAIRAEGSDEPGSNVFDAQDCKESRRHFSRWLGSTHVPLHGAYRGTLMRLRTAAIAGVVAVTAVSVAFIALQPPKKISMKPMIGDFWAHRVAYPTMHFSPSWYLDAEVEDKLVLSAVPAGAEHFRSQPESPLQLTPDTWTFLGPQALTSTSRNWGSVSGRVNVIAVDPTGPDIDGHHTVFAASDGGGVWKSTNCCNANTTWRNTTDSAQIASIAIGELYIEPSNPDVIYAGTGDLRYGSFSFGASGLLKSTDKGETWTVLGEDVFTPFYPPSAGLGFPQYQAIGKVVTSPHDPDTIIVGTKTGLFVSNNAGVDWTGPCVTNPHSSQRQDITGLFAIDAGGGEATLIAAVGTRGNPTTVQPDLAFIGANGVYRTTLPQTGCPATAAWTLLDNGWPAGTGNGNPAGKVLGRIELAIAPSNPQILYAMGAHTTNSNVLGVWRSNNGGTTWTQTATTAGVQAQSCANATGGGAQMWYDAGLTVDPNNAENVLLSGVDLYRSTNGGTTFQNITCGYGNGFVHVDHHARAYLPDGAGGWDSNKALLGVDGGVYYTANVLFGTGGTSSANRPSYISLNQTIGSIEFYSGDITGNFANATTPGASGGAQDNGSSWVRWSSVNPGPAQWTERNGGDGIYTRIEPVLENRWYYSSQNGAVVVSTSGPNSTPSAAFPNSGGNWGGDTLSFVMPFEIYRYGALDAPGSGCTSATGCTFLIAGTTRVWETIQGAIPRTSWYANSPNLTKGTLGNRSFVNQLAYAVKTPAAAIAGTNDGNVWYGHGMNQGAANTATWVNLTAANAVLPNRPVMDVVIDVGSAATPASTAVGYAALGGFNQNTPTQPGHIYQVLCENNCATFTWRDISGNLPNVPANSVAFNPNVPEQVFAGTDWGVYFTNDAYAENPVWYRFDNGLPRVMVWDMAVDRGFTTLAVFTRGRGAWAWPLPTQASDLIFKDGFENP